MRRKVKMATEMERIYYLSAMGSASTIIGRKMISPNMPPEPFTIEQYDAQKERIEFYEEHGVISVARPGTRAAVVKADEIKREEKRQAEVFAGESVDEEPDPMLRARGFSVSEKYAESRMGRSNRRPPAMSTFTVPGDNSDEGEVSLKCLAIVGSGDRCGNDAKSDLLICGTHLRMLKRGGELKDELGRRISSDGKEITE
jgi:hypothetical protein